MMSHLPEIKAYDEKTLAEVELLKEVISGVRNVRKERAIPNKETLNCVSLRMKTIRHVLLRC